MSEVDDRDGSVTQLTEEVRLDGSDMEPSRDALATIAATAARTVKGVHDLASRSSLRRGREINNSGVHVQLFDHRVVFDIRVVAADDVPLLDIATAVRREVIAQVESQTDLRVIEVNVAIDDLVEVLAG